MRRVWVLAVVTAAFGAVFAPAYPAGVARVSQRGTTGGGPYARDVDLRRTWGLSTDETFVAALHASSRGSVSPFGIPMSREEITEMWARQEVSEAVTPVAAEWARRQPLGVYGGMYVDQAGGGVVVVLVTRDAERARRELAALVTRPEGVRVREVERSRDYLGWVKARVREYGFGRGVNAVGIDTEHNVVTVSTTDVEWARHALPLVVPADAIQVEYAEPPVPK